MGTIVCEEAEKFKKKMTENRKGLSNTKKIRSNKFQRQIHSIPRKLCVAVARISVFNYSYSFLPCVIKTQKQTKISPGLPEARQQDEIPALQR